MAGVLADGDTGHRGRHERGKSERDRFIRALRRYLLTDGDINEFEGEAVPEAYRVLFVARWLNGAASVEWLLTHPEWFEYADICSIAFDQAIAAKQRQAEQQQQAGRR